MKDRADVLLAICRNLRQLRNDLGGFEHTTHGCVSGGNIYSVSGALARCFETPTPYTVSDLYQSIGDLLTTEGVDL